jgi:hypothetical protein
MYYVGQKLWFCWTQSIVVVLAVIEETEDDYYYIVRDQTGKIYEATVYELSTNEAA